MATRANASSSEEGKQYLVACEGCSLERTVDGRTEAERIGQSHRRATDHDVLAVEWPR